LTGRRGGPGRRGPGKSLQANTTVTSIELESDVCWARGAAQAASALEGNTGTPSSLGCSDTDAGDDDDFPGRPRLERAAPASLAWLRGARCGGAFGEAAGLEDDGRAWTVMHSELLAPWPACSIADLSAGPRPLAGGRGAAGWCTNGAGPTAWLPVVEDANTRWCHRQGAQGESLQANITDISISIGGAGLLGGSFGTANPAQVRAVEDPRVVLAARGALLPCGTGSAGRAPTAEAPLAVRFVEGVPDDTPVLTGRRP